LCEGITKLGTIYVCDPKILVMEKIVKFL
jgi:hypothetical protein